MNTILIIYLTLALVHASVAFGLRMTNGVAAGCIDWTDVVMLSVGCMAEGLLWLPFAYVRSLQSIYKEGN